MIRIDQYGPFNLIQCDLNSVYELKPIFHQIAQYSQPNLNVT